METKQVIVLRKDLNMRKGKMIAQGAHASLDIFISLLTPLFRGDRGREQVYAYSIELTDAMESWIAGSFTKVCVGVSSEQELLNVYNAAKVAGLPCSIITDAGRTEFGGVPTKTAVAIGPGPVAEIDKITGTLTLL